jgi:hypothetical protein
MATDAKTVSGQPPVHTPEDNRVVDSAQKFWNKNGKVILYALVAIIIVGGGYFAYTRFFKAPEEMQAADAIWKAQDYYKMDSFRLALNGDGANPGFLRVISKHGGTKSGNLAKFYAGSCYLQMGDFNNAIKIPERFFDQRKRSKTESYRFTG